MSRLISITPSPNDLWRGIGGHFDSVTQVLCEFIDNSLSNFNSSQTNPSSDVWITITEEEEGVVKVVIEDTGTGIDDLAAAMTIGAKKIQATPLNEHGFGLKHALASGNPANDNWYVCTRTLDQSHNGVYSAIEAPYGFELEIIEKPSEEWPGQSSGTGTILGFSCSKSFFNKLRQGTQGGANAGFTKCLEYLAEDLGYTYGRAIEDGQIGIKMGHGDGNWSPVQAVKPNIKAYVKGNLGGGSGSLKLDLGEGKVDIEFEFIETDDPKNSLGTKNLKRHYLNNQQTNGLEVSLNNRVVASNIFKDVWQRDNHPSFNSFLCRLNILSTDRSRLPQTRTAKNGIRLGDPKIETLYEWLRTAVVPPKQSAYYTSEKQLRDELLEKLNALHLKPTKNITSEYLCWKSIGGQTKIDLFCYDGADVTIYECKKDYADLQDLYQLKLYWDGLVSDGISPTKAILVAANSASAVGGLMSLLNSSTDARGQQYDFEFRTWYSLTILYP